MKHKTYKKGFTLIELLIVIAIIGILSAIIFPNYMAARERARDTQRKSDLAQIQKAIELYKQDNNSALPPSITFGSPWANGSTIYMSKVPQDPLGVNDDSSYVYTPDGTDPAKYTLCACLENTADTDSHVVDCADCSGDCGTRIATTCYELVYQ